LKHLSEKFITYIYNYDFIADSSYMYK